MSDSTPPQDPTDPSNDRWTRPAREPARPRAQGAAPPAKTPIQPSDGWLATHLAETLPEGLPRRYPRPVPTVPQGATPKVTKYPIGASGRPPRAKRGEGPDPGARFRVIQGGKT